MNYCSGLCEEGSDYAFEEARPSRHTVLGSLARMIPHTRDAVSVGVFFKPPNATLHGMSTTGLIEKKKHGRD